MPDTCYAPGRDPPGGTGGDELFALSGVSPARLFTTRAHHRGHIHTAFPEHGPQPSRQRESLGRTVLRTGGRDGEQPPDANTDTGEPGETAARRRPTRRRELAGWRVGLPAAVSGGGRPPSRKPTSASPTEDEPDPRSGPGRAPCAGTRRRPLPQDGGSSWTAGRSPGRAHTVVMTLRAPGWNLRIFLLSAREALTRHSLGFGGRAGLAPAGAGAGCRGRARGRAGRPPPPPTRASPSLPLDSPSPKRSVV